MLSSRSESLFASLSSYTFIKLSLDDRVEDKLVVPVPRGFSVDKFSMTPFRASIKLDSSVESSAKR